MIGLRYFRKYEIKTRNRLTIRKKLDKGMWEYRPEKLNKIMSEANVFFNDWFLGFEENLVFLLLTLKNLTRRRREARNKLKQKD